MLKSLFCIKASKIGFCIYSCFVIIIWFRKDLRLSDNEVLWEACKTAECVLPLYCFDPRDYGESQLLKLPKTDFFRTNFIIESVCDLKRSLQSKGANLLITVGKPEEVISSLVTQYSNVSAVYASSEPLTEEQTIELKLFEILKEKNIPLKLFETGSLFKQTDLPFEVKQLPDVFTVFKNKVEKHCTVRALFEEPSRIRVPENIDWTEIPTLHELGVTEKIYSSKAFMQFSGGETVAKQRLDEYFFAGDFLKNYKNTRNEMLGKNYSSKFSAWLAQGCISPVQIYREIKRYEKEHIANESTYWLFYELLWREFFRWSGLKYGNKIFRASGLAKTDRTWKQDFELFEKWKNAQTGEAFIDANITELNQSGFMSNRGRQNVASYFCKHLGLDWRWGAEYFEAMLIDYDVCSNWGNWAYQAGVGHDPRDRIFNIKRQSEIYDPEGAYVDYWLGSLGEQLKFL